MSPLPRTDVSVADPLTRTASDPTGPVAACLDARLPLDATVLGIGAFADGALPARLQGRRRRVVALVAGAGDDRPTSDRPAGTVVVGEAGQLPFADGSLDGAFATGDYFRPSTLDPSRGLAELHRVVRPGAPIVLVGSAGDDDVTGMCGGAGGEPLGWFADRGFAVEVFDTTIGFRDASEAHEVLAHWLDGCRPLPEPVPLQLRHRVFVATVASRGPAEVRIRGMRLAEAERVGSLTIEAYDRFGTIEGPYRTFLADPRLRLDTSSALLVAEVDGEVVGTVTYVVPGDGEWEGPEPAPGDCGFRVLAVDPDVQGRGVGPRLVAACRERAGEQGRHRLFISSMSWMTRAHRMYERAGFVRRPDLDVMFPGGLGVIFTLDLTDEAEERFPAPGPVPPEPPWYADAWAT
ncbi:GNAT family N-acetyltransferase [Egicoccus halophilus]|uniref:N-acetyltransferase domain-containing protein n=1 Tax=Egicoccus halophilus TaxID=1670830 RepID=A0A8J3ACD1_9ACTN|nr:GNAT family N-acetyltransferase [Egicoccus halophilus]GGI08342.1 hypothetical protein GCM10011354_28610 [Egicoccus halophilus]